MRSRLVVSDSSRTTQRIRVHFADAPTDVLVWLTDQSADEWWHPQVIADRVAPSDAVTALRSTFGALSTLYACGLVEGLNFEGVSRFRASDEGRKVIEEAGRG